MKLIFFNLILLTFTAIEIQAQSCKKPCPYYNDFVRLAQADTVKNTQTKLNYYRAAIVAAKDCHCPELEQNANEQIDMLFVLIEAEKRRAEAQSQMILEQQDSIDVALIDAEKANRKNLKIINAMDFYEGELALAFKNEKYGFINKVGETAIEFSYDRGEPFNQKTGFAEMERGGVQYLIDVNNNEYKLINISKILKDADNTEQSIYQEDIKWLEGAFDTGINAVRLIEEEIIVHQNNLKKDSIALRKERNENIKGYWVNQIEAEKEALSLTRSKLKKYQKNKQTEIGNRLSELRVKLDTIEHNLKIANDRLFNALKRGNEKLALDFSKQYNLDIIGILEKIAGDEFISNKVGLLFLNETDLDRIPSFISKFKNLKGLNVSGTKIQVLPELFTELVQLVRLDLSETLLRDLPKDIGNLTALKYLNILETPLTELPFSFSKLKKLEILDLSTIGMLTLPEFIGELHSLRVLKLPILLEEWPTSISKLKKLEILDLSMTMISTLPENIGELHNLRMLNFPVLVKEFPVSIFNLKKLESLDFSMAWLELLPESIGQLYNLKALKFPLSLKELPANIINLKNLDTLNLTMTNLTRLPESIGQYHNLKALFCPPSLKELPLSLSNLKNLELLELKYTKIKHVPESIGQLSNLKKLSLPASLKEFPLSFSNLKNLESLNLSMTQIKRIPKFVGELQNLKELSLPASLEELLFSISDLKNLESLAFNMKDVKILPEEIGQLLKLKRLYVPPFIEQLPKSFTQLTNLEYLSLYNTKIKKLPEEIENFTKLKVLRLKNSAINTLSENFCKLTQLTKLNLEGTKIKSLPQNIGKLIRLRSLNLKNTTIQKIPISIEQLINLEKLTLDQNPNLETFPDFISKLKNLRQVTYTLYDNERYTAYKIKIEALKKEMPFCEFKIIDMKKEPK